MIRPRPSWGLFVGAVCGFAAAAAAGAQTPRFLEPAPGVRLETGAAVSVSWTAGLADEADVDEMELVLSLDGGESFPLRVTRTLSPTAQSFSWRVPALPAAHARLALRSGRRGAEESETIRMTSGDFAIVPGPDAFLEQVFRVRGEWRTREALESPAEPPAPSSFRLPEEELRPAFGPDRPAEPPTPSPDTPDRPRRDAPIFVVSSPNEPQHSVSPASRPPSIPLRQ